MTACSILDYNALAMAVGLGANVDAGATQDSIGTGTDMEEGLWAAGG